MLWRLSGRVFPNDEGFWTRTETLLMLKIAKDTRIDSRTIYQLISPSDAVVSCYCVIILDRRELVFELPAPFDWDAKVTLVLGKPFRRRKMAWTVKKCWNFNVARWLDPTYAPLCMGVFAAVAGHKGPVGASIYDPVGVLAQQESAALLPGEIRRRPKKWWQA